MNAPPRLFDRPLLRDRRRRAAAAGNEHFLLGPAAEDLAQRLQTVNRRFPFALDLGTPGDELRIAIRATGKVDEIIACEPLVRLRDAAYGPRIAGDEEALPFVEGAFDLVVSALALHWVNDLPGSLAQIRRTLRPDGLFLAALVAGDSLSELRESLAAAEAETEDGISPRVAPFIDVRTLGALLQRSGFALPVTDLDRIPVRYSDFSGLLRDLRAMGATNALVERRRVPLRRSTLARAAEIYRERFADNDGRLRATFDLLSISAWAPAPSQQQPLPPGSAKARLADALATRERPAGEKAGPRRKF